MKQILYTLIGTLLILPVWFSPALAENRALLIGVGQYAVSDANLPGIEKDLKNMYEVAQAMGFSKNQIRILADEDATLQGIKGAIEDWLIKGLKSNDKGLFYMSSHGSSIKDENGDEKDNQDEVLLPHDTQVQNNTLVNTLVDDQLGRLLDKIQSNNLYVMIDACHSGTATKAISLFNGQKEKFFYYPGMPVHSKGSYSIEAADQGNYAALNAAQDNESALATSKGSLFTLGVLSAVNSARNNNRSLNLRQLKEDVSEFIQNNTSPDKVHQPNLVGNESLMGKNILVNHESQRVSSLWRKLEYLINNADYPVQLSVNSTQNKIGDCLVFKCDVKHGGYLNIIEVGEKDTQPTVLFPNKYHPDNKIFSDTTVTIPSREFGGFKLTAQQTGKSLLVAILTEEEINAHKEGDGGKEFFKKMSKRTLEKASYAVEKSSGLGAGSVVTQVFN
ncbi:caspase family protein [Desulfobacula toluolica]|uniref:Predicted peptidase C14, ccaspase n=1 Tax=Desulfobacula toluolica (strain DSM 7467 / Tol2) TaxID=651182 RepID=K0NIB6_DESTT|nr:caspase family protein [Desulfobacula toluolica]CCK80685.1 predicted peptidase C14, ccaspase [Desulfobacula toluolica Tol2]